MFLRFKGNDKRETNMNSIDKFYIREEYDTEMWLEQMVDIITNKGYYGIEQWEAARCELQQLELDPAFMLAEMLDDFSYLEDDYLN